ncbi:uncharacterized protein I303_100887 [Kwoniella dejecticola CBS 10117]|uniref:Uncharacterized protein n=1 Tax=Kwoniella dejecticola CBS 10117 TaxID=1296121 RepID=A0A1A6AG81_9TREE|nr:uncharacterized protein I303_00891 [Kwoniella dejecticola CBS 10117]OBR89069.1 hypothetical protein I303_00891 [Kwoniella dejecticola CBS 10117]
MPPQLLPSDVRSGRRGISVWAQREDTSSEPLRRRSRQPRGSRCTLCVERKIGCNRDDDSQPTNDQQGPTLFLSNAADILGGNRRDSEDSRSERWPPSRPAESMDEDGQNGWNPSGGQIPSPAARRYLELVEASRAWKERAELEMAFRS